MKRTILLFCFVLLAKISLAQELELYVYNRSFSGKLWLNHSLLYAELDPLLQILKVQVKERTQTSILLATNAKAKPISLVRKEKIVFVPAKEVAEALQLGFRYNPETKIGDLYRPKAVFEQNVDRSGVNSGYDVRVVNTEEQKGIDEMAVYATVENSGKTVSDVRVTCDFTDEDRHVLETQNKNTGTLASGARTIVSFKFFYPKASNSQTYRDYNTKIKYNVSVSVLK